MYRVLSDKFLVILRTLFLLPLQKSFSSNSSSTNWSYFGIKIQALWTSDADRCNFKGNFFCWVFSVTQGFGELIFTVSVVGEKERRATLSNHSSLWASGSFCTLELWRWRKPGSGYSPQPLKAGWALLKPPKQMVVDRSSCVHGRCYAHLNEKKHCSRFSGLRRTSTRLKAQSDSKFGEEAPQMVIYVPPPSPHQWLNEEMGRAQCTDIERAQYS